MFMEALFIIDKKWNQPTYPSTDKWRNKIQYIHTMEYYLGEVLIHSTIWMDLENVMLSERTQSQKARCYKIPFM